METLLHPDNRMHENPDRNFEANRRLEALENTIKRYQSEHSFVEGATVFGSTMHGHAHEKSDVDAMVFINPDKVSTGYGVELDDNDYRDLAGVVQHDLLSELGLQDIAVSSGKRNDIQVFPINEQLVDKRITDYETSTDEYPVLDRSVSALFHPSVADGERIAELRRNVLTRISKSQNLQELWDDIVRSTWTFEGDIHNDESKIPEQLEEAIKTY